MRGSAIHLCVMLLTLAGAAPPAHSDSPPATEPEPSAQQPARLTKSALEVAVEKEAQSYKIREKDGKRMYCRKETVLGSKLPKTICLTRDELTDRVVAAQENRDALTRPRAAQCGTSSGCN